MSQHQKIYDRTGYLEGKGMQKYFILPLIAVWMLSPITQLNAESILLTPEDIDIPYQIETLGHPVMDGNTSD